MGSVQKHRGSPFSIACTSLDDVVMDASVRGMRFADGEMRQQTDQSESAASGSSDRSRYYIKGCGEKHQIGVGKEDVTCSTLGGASGLSTTLMMSTATNSQSSTGAFCPYGGDDLAGMAYTQASGCGSLVQGIPVGKMDWWWTKESSSKCYSGHSYPRECHEFLFPGQTAHSKNQRGKKGSNHDHNPDLDVQSSRKSKKSSRKSKDKKEAQRQVPQSMPSFASLSQDDSVASSTNDGSSYSGYESLRPYPIKKDAAKSVSEKDTSRSRSTKDTSHSVSVDDTFRSVSTKDSGSLSLPSQSRSEPPSSAKVVSPPGTPPQSVPYQSRVEEETTEISPDVQSASSHHLEACIDQHLAKDDDPFGNDISGIRAQLSEDQSELAESMHGSSHLEAPKAIHDSPGTYSASTKFISNRKSALPVLEPVQLPASMCDLLVRVGKEDFQHSAAILSYASTYLQQHMVRVDDRPHQFEIDFSDHSPNAWRLVLEFLHPRSLGRTEINWNVLPTVLPWFAQLELDVLLDDADQFLVQTVIHRSTGSLRVDNLLLWLRIALRCNLTQSVAAAQRAILERLHKPASASATPSPMKAPRSRLEAKVGGQGKNKYCSLDLDPTVMSALGDEKSSSIDQMDVDRSFDAGNDDDDDNLHPALGMSISLDWNLADLQSLATCLVEFDRVRNDLWDAAIIPYLPHDLDVHDAYTLVSNPLFPYLMREGMMQLCVVERARAVLQSRSSLSSDPILSRLIDRSHRSSSHSGVSSMASSVYSNGGQELTQDLLHVLLSSTMEQLEQFAQESEVSVARRRMTKQIDQPQDQKEAANTEGLPESTGDVVVTVQDLSMIREEESYDDMEPPPLRPRQKGRQNSSFNRSRESQDRTFEC